MSRGWILLFCFPNIGILYSVLGHDAKGFDDTVLFNLAWHGKDELMTNGIDDEEIIVSTTNKEKYKCIIPSIAAKEVDGDVQYNGPSPIDLLMPLFTHSTCSFRIESYWTYEVCHGNYIRQYHEERHEKTSKLQEYYLGKWDKQKTAGLKAEFEKTENDGDQLKYKKIDGLNLPYLELEMNSGTVCDLNGEPRVTKVLYVCYMHGKNEVYSLKETSTCNYEVIILTPMLCAHPKYKPIDTEENKINCYALDKAPKKPKNLLMMEIESMKLKYQKLTVGPIKVGLFPVDIPIVDSTNRDGIVENEITGIEEENTSPMDGLTKKIRKSKELKPLLEFLDGGYCLTGGSGWWKFELCFGKHVRQFHEDTSIFLGFFDKEKHLEWLEQNPSIKTKRNQLSNFYGGGDECDKTQTPRQVEVKLKCTEHSISSNAIALYLLEPKPCEYILNVESSLICDILPYAEEDMLLPESLQKLDEETLYIIDNSNINN
ncbi:endoplasmic reticulum lectin 1-like isoform X2 [Uranotaenia lowii]|uniref:endoplasmic reticulum lectin 1-like isoform X2 n=1 Tax=Uranotaenia lowii TaxID=190385 RepID=UPI00247ABA59|nr:endoplasmic reticulum lectin 1-like isoform X2 [Uranotaenia lowii]XP_055593762.1 endoplasmic reticulum lectin 1-like isoform X2 [Uranotaenia lowii]